MGGKVIIIGSVNVDIVARASRLPRAGETVGGGDLSVLLGGKGANQAVAAARAGAETAMVGVVGDLSFGLDPIARIRSYGVDTSTIQSVTGPTGAALITVYDEGENQITVSPGANAQLSASHVGDMACDIVLAQLETPQTATLEAFRKAKAAGGTTILNAAPAEPMANGLMDLTDILIVNETELARYGACDVPTDATTLHAAMRSARHRDGQCIVATLGASGATALVGDDVIAVPAARAARVVDTTGAGDCFCGALAAHLAGGASLSAAMAFASAAASLAVETAGAAPSMPTRMEIIARLGEQG